MTNTINEYRNLQNHFTFISNDSFINEGFIQFLNFIETEIKYKYKDIKKSILEEEKTDNYVGKTKQILGKINEVGENTNKLTEKISKKINSNTLIVKSEYNLTPKKSLKAIGLEKFSDIQEKVFDGLKNICNKIDSFNLETVKKETIKKNKIALFIVLLKFFR